MNKIFFTLTLCFVCCIFTSIAQEDNKPVIYVIRSLNTDSKNLSGKNTFVNADKDPEIYDNKKKIKSLTSYVRQKIDLSQLDYDSICGNLFDMSFVISATGKVEKMHIITGITYP